MDKTIISFKDFTFKYLTQAKPTLKNIDLEIMSGEKILIAGPSGSGKSTLAKCLNGLIPNEDTGTISGSCIVSGHDITKTSLFDLSFTTSTILQDPDSQFIGLTVAEDIAFALENDAVEHQKMHQIVQKWATELNLEELLDHSPQALSGGQKQRVALAGVLVNGSPILLFDEPLANLDPASGYQTMQLIDTLQQKTKATVIIVEHRVEEVLTCSLDRIVILADGQIIADAPPNALLRQNILQQAGIRPPLYLEALRQAKISLEQLPDVTSVEKLPTDPTISRALAKLQQVKPSTSPENKNTPQLEIHDVSFSYAPDQKYPLTNIELTVNAGEFISIAGQNGAGKTTLIKLICGFLTGSGKMTWEGQDLATASIKERAEKIGYVMQDPNQMISQKMIFDEVALGLRLRGITAEAQIKERVEKVLKICGLYEFRNWPILALSYGQKKRVTIASILILEPKLLILDEPTAGQDRKTYTEIMQFLRRLNQQGCTIIIITHDMQLMLEYTERTLVFSHGKLQADLTPAQLLRRPELLQQASLRQTSLYQLAQKYNLENTDAFIAGFNQLTLKGVLNE